MGVLNRIVSSLKTSIYSMSKDNRETNVQKEEQPIFYSKAIKSLHNDIRRLFSSQEDNISVDSPVNSEYTDVSRLTQNSIIDKIKDYSFLRSVLEAIEIPLVDVIRKSTWDFSLSPIDSEDLVEQSRVRNIEKKVKKLMSTFDLSDFVRKELTEWLMYGFRVYYLQVDDNKIFVSKILLDNSIAFFHREKYAWIVVNAKNKYGLQNNDLTNINNKYSVPYFFERRVFENITEEQAVEEGILKKDKEELTPLSSIILEFQKIYGVGFLDSVAKDLFNLYIREIVYDWLSMLEVIQPKLIGVTLSGEKFDAPNITQAVTEIESMLNDSCSILIQAGMGGQNIEPVLYSMLANRYQIVALTQQASSIDAIDITDLNETLQSMKEDINQKKLYILQNKGIPEELHNGEGNRWEIIARTDKYLDNIKRSCVSIEAFVKQFIFALCNQLGYEEILSTDQIHFNLDVSALTSNYIENSGFSFLSEKLADLSELLENTESISELDVIDSDKIKQMIADKIKEVDPAIYSAINFGKDSLGEEELDTVDEIVEKMSDIDK